MAVVLPSLFPRGGAAVQLPPQLVAHCLAARGSKISCNSASISRYADSAAALHVAASHGRSMTCSLRHGSSFSHSLGWCVALTSWANLLRSNTRTKVGGRQRVEKKGGYFDAFAVGRQLELGSWSANSRISNLERVAAGGEQREARTQHGIGTKLRNLRVVRRKQRRERRSADLR